MVEVQDDIEYFEVTLIIPEGSADIRNTVVPTQVNPGEPFNIEYDIHNLGGGDILWGKIEVVKDPDPNVVIPGSEWTEEIPAGQYKHVLTSIEGIQGPTKFAIRAGHNED